MRLAGRRAHYRAGLLVAASLAWTLAGHGVAMAAPEPAPSQLEKTTMQSMENHCLGRFIVPLPRGSSAAVATSIVESPFAYLGKVSRKEFEQVVAERWRALQDKTLDESDLPYSSPSTRNDLSENAVIFASEHVRLDFGGPGFEGTETHQSEGYLWQDGHLFHFTPRMNSAPQIALAMKTLRVRAFDAVPNQAGVCTAGSFFADPREGDAGEAVRFAIDIPGAPPMLLNVETVTVLSAEQAGALEPGKPDFTSDNSQDFRGQVLVDRSRQVAGLAGMEYITATTAKEGRRYLTEIAARWHFPGEVGGGAAKPFTQLSLEVTYASDTEPAQWAVFPAADESGRPPEAKFMGLWNGILEGTRLR
jgi:hypothetical protein